MYANSCHGCWPRVARALLPLQPADPALVTPYAAPLITAQHNDSPQDGTIQALVLDSYVLEYVASSRCDVSVVGQPFQVVRRALMCYNCAGAFAELKQAHSKGLAASTAAGELGGGSTGWPSRPARDLTLHFSHLMPQYDSAVVFPVGFNNSALLKAYNRALVMLQDSGGRAVAEDEELGDLAPLARLWLCVCACVRACVRACVLACLRVCV